MRPSPPQGRIRPKISSMPRQKSEATACLDVYKLVVERKRLQQDLEKLEERRQIIQARVQQLDGQIVALEQTVKQLREEPTSAPAPAPAPSSIPLTDSTGTFTTLLLDY